MAAIILYILRERQTLYNKQNVKYLHLLNNIVNLQGVHLFLCQRVALYKAKDIVKRRIVMLAHCENALLNERKNYLGASASHQLRKTVDAFIENKITKLTAGVPFAEYFKSNKIYDEYYKRHLIETIWRMRLLRVAESKALAQIAKQNSLAARSCANYERKEIKRDELFFQNLKVSGISREMVLATEPYLSTKMLSRFFSYLLDHEELLGIVAYSYLVETVNIKVEPKKSLAMKVSSGEQNIRGQTVYLHTDSQGDRPGEVWQVVCHLIRSRKDIKNLYRYLDEMQELLAMYFRELYEDQVKNKTRMAA